METFGTVVVYIIMACAVTGMIVSIVKPKAQLGKEFLAGIDSIGPIFLPVAGIMAAAPYLTTFVSYVFGPVFAALQADPAMAAGSLIAVDMGGYQLAEALAETRESWMMATMAAYTLGGAIVFTIPVGLRMIQRRDHKFFALGTMCGILAVPVSVLIFSMILVVTNPVIRDAINTSGPATYVLSLAWTTVGRNLIPLLVLCVLLALGLMFITDAMIKGFIVFGRSLEAALKIVFVLVVVDYFTGLPSRLMGALFQFEPIIADEADIFRALEVAGAVGIMLCGAFPMVHLIKTYLAKPLTVIGKFFHLSPEATAGILAASANGIALFAMFKHLKGRDKVITVAFVICSGYLFGDHLSFTANFQPSMIAPVMIAKVTGGVLGIVFAFLLAVKKADQLEATQMELDQVVEKVVTN
ncbi:MAG: ethanolamine utilization protein EutH [Propionibacteriaceae bacterium]|jgi:ethanolamine transporter|nr:ethanolamine utilization protein EutH [Propionibacteriaceae bacterium]